ncbi:hypothetical protein F4820DRAFT_451442 [Hypoxylon rubiginosum]|uniref:Uncharacterized protein n=1 Tax=Hypoxylon rubiginosum TaxID=110542 RepID=A0ACB9YRW1_9PEZI|nr:hypothetical protein F4820DRAFT_451442 [Hypoxylon rubiginosum]
MASGLISLRSKEGVGMFISRDAANMSGLLKDEIENLSDAEIDAITWDLTEIDADTLEKVVLWCEDHCQNAELRSLLNDTTPLLWPSKPEIVCAFQRLFSDELQLFKTFRAGSFMKIEPIHDMALRTIIDEIKEKDVDQKRAYFGVVTGEDSSEDQELRRDMFNLFRTSWWSWM